MILNNVFKRFRFLKNEQRQVELFDLNNVPIKEGDQVQSMRYDLGKCILRIENEGYYYESIENGRKVHFTLMIDAVTKRQKVVKSEN